MRLTRSVLVGSLASALLAGSLVLPAAAASSDGKMAIVQGYTGTRVDVCVNGREIKSRMPFGCKMVRSFSRGLKVVKVFKAGPGSCRGTKLAQRAIRFPRGSDLTIVVGRRSPKVLVFDNNDRPPMPVDHMELVFRHAADYGGVTFRHRVEALPGEEVVPALLSSPRIWKRGDEGWNFYPILVGGRPEWATTWVSKEIPYAPGTVRVAGPTLVQIGGHSRYEWIFIGRNYKTRLVVLKRGR